MTTKLQRQILATVGNTRPVSREDAIAAFGGGVVGERAGCYGGAVAGTAGKYNPLPFDGVQTHGKRKPRKAGGVCRKVHSPVEDRRSRQDARTSKARVYTGTLARIVAAGGLER